MIKSLDRPPPGSTSGSGWCTCIERINGRITAQLILWLESWKNCCNDNLCYICLELQDQNNVRIIAEAIRFTYILLQLYDQSGGGRIVANATFVSFQIVKDSSGQDRWRGDICWFLLQLDQQNNCRDRSRGNVCCIFENYKTPGCQDNRRGNILCMYRSRKITTSLKTP